MRIESRHRFVPAAAFRFRGRANRTPPRGAFPFANYCARVDFVFRVNNQRELVRNASMRPDVESDACCRLIANYAGDRDVSKTNGAAL
jgi:hypothetical protein